jgi:demethylmenaquinone methyltransferase/2-methoxy-6-polyprenyl-1,4-benzoquinol methylase
MTQVEATVQPSPQPSPKKAETIRHMFGEVAPRYDLLNTVLSLGIHHLWRKKLVGWSGVKAGDRVLDCATGTGDLAFAFEKKLGTSGQVVGTDFCEPMLVHARAKAVQSGSRTKFDVADVTKLPFEAASFDIATISFGIRNVNDPQRGLSELGRVVRPGGAVLVLEFGQPQIPVFSGFYRFYSMYVLPKIGGLISGQKQAYDYLQKSSAQFPCREDFLKMAESTGQFSKLEYRPVSGGIAYIYKLTRK